jgi:hypothetical protein
LARTWFPNFVPWLKMLRGSNLLAVPLESVTRYAC